MQEYSYELTDTFGGELNYSWVRRGKIRATSMLGAVRIAKRETGLNGQACARHDFGDSVELRPYGACLALTVNA